MVLLKHYHQHQQMVPDLKQCNLASHISHEMALDHSLAFQNTARTWKGWLPTPRRGEMGLTTHALLYAQVASALL